MVAKSSLFAEGLLTIRPPAPATFDRCIDGFITVEKPLLERWGIEIVGGWRRMTGLVNQVMQIYRFDSFRALEESAIKSFNDPDYAGLQNLFDWVDRPDWRYARQMGGLAPFSSLDRLMELRAEEPEVPRQYVELRPRIAWGRLPEAFELLKARIETWEQEGVFQQAVSYSVEYGQYGQVVIVGVLPGGASSLDRLREVVEPECARRLGDLLGEEEVHLLTPLPYSRLR